MPLPNLSLLKKPKVFRDTRTFTLPTDGDPVVWTLTFEAQGGFPQQLLIDDKKNDLIAAYVNGDKQVRTADGHVVIISETLVDRIAAIMAIDKTEVGESELRYSFTDWAILADCAGELFYEINDFAVEVVNKARGIDGNSLKNASSATGDSSSEPPPALGTSTPTS